MNAKRYITERLARAGVEINGNKPWDIQVHDDRLYSRVIRQGTLGAGEAYVEGWWDSERLELFFERVLRADIDRLFRATPTALVLYLASLLSNRQNPSRAYEVGRRHYDIGNDLYKVMLDSRMVYTCAYWESADNLDEAQEAKLEMVCRKLDLHPGQKVLDIGCGWGSFARFAAERYGVEVVGITVSREQVALGRELCHGLPVEIRYQDYRDLDEKFDHVVSLGMIEHVGSRNYRLYFKKVRDCLRPDGLFLLQSIGGNYAVRNTDPWIHRFIFPNSMVPSASQLSSAYEGTFVMEDWHNFGMDYAKTLMAWFENFRTGWEELAQDYPPEFKRMWSYYLLMCAGSFRARKNQLWQIVLSPEGSLTRRFRRIFRTMPESAASVQ